MSEVAFAPVGVAVFGVSTPFAYWGFHLARQVIEAIAGQTLHLHITSLAQLREGFARRAGGSVVVTSDFPDAELARFVCGSGLPLIAFSDDPGDTLDWTIKTRQLSPLDAARFNSRLFSTLALPFAADRTLLIAAARNEPPERIVAAIVEHLFPGRGEWLASRTFEFLVESGAIARDKTVERSEYRAAEAGPPTRSLADARRAIGAYGELMTGRWPEQIEWSLELFTRLDNRAIGDPIDLTGPARALFYGPYLNLPIGDWIARVEFEIDGALSGVEALADVRVNEAITEKSFEMPAKGIFAYELSFHVADPHHPIEIRLFTKKSAIEGVFLPRSVKVRPQPRGGV
ncbi:MAG TPA: hypothetical protein VN715_08150 [Roseiarcus sp.]|nr:hypothetical protein [Roseiarcus sp.]